MQGQDLALSGLSKSRTCASQQRPSPSSPVVTNLGGVPPTSGSQGSRAFDRAWVVASSSRMRHLSATGASQRPPRGARGTDASAESPRGHDGVSSALAPDTSASRRDRAGADSHVSAETSAGAAVRNADDPVAAKHNVARVLNVDYRLHHDAPAAFSGAQQTNAWIALLLESLLYERRRANRRLMSDQFGTTEDVAEITGFSEGWVRLHAKELGGWKTAEGRGGKWRFPLAEIAQHARSRSPGGSPHLPVPPAPAPAKPSQAPPSDETYGLTPRPRM